MKNFLRSGNTKSGCFILILLFFVINGAFTQVKFSAVCPQKQIGKNQYLEVQYVVENGANIDEINPPSFKNFSVVSGPDQQSSMTNINGVVKQSISLDFVLKPNSTGNFTLPPATAKVDGKTYQSNSLSIQVTNSSSPPSTAGTSISPFSNSPFSNMITDAFPEPSIHQYDDYILHKGENLSEKIKKNLFVKVDVSKTSCYVGEPVVATYKLYTRLKSESNLTKSPSFNGFSVSEMEVPGNNATTTEKYNGREYSVYILRKVQLYPLQPGNIECDPAEVDNHITFIKAEYAEAQKGNPFYDMMRDFVDATTPAEGIEEQKISLQSKPVSILVKPLPELNKPAGFKGAIGTFTINAALDKNSMTTDEAANLTVSLSGSGNMQMVNAPNVSWPQGMEAFDTKSSENIDKTSVPLRGEKLFTYPFTASVPGRYTIPAIDFSFFDVTTHTYKTLFTKPLTIEVKKGAGIKPLIASQPNKIAAEKPEGANDKHLTLPWILTIIGFTLMGTVLWVAARVARKKAPLIVSAASKNFNEKQEEPAGTDQVIIQQNPLVEAEQILTGNSVGNFYYTLNNCLKKYLSAKLNFPEKELGKKKINELLDKHNVGIGTTLMLASLLENIEINLYAPPSSVHQLQAVYDDASEVVALLDKQIS